MFDLSGGELVVCGPRLAVTAQRCLWRQARDQCIQTTATDGRKLKPQVQSVIALKVGLNETPTFCQDGAEAGDSPVVTP